MAEVHTRKEKKGNARAQIRLVCKGFTKSEFADIKRVLKEDFGCKVVLRNPIVPQFDANAIHHMIALVTDSAIGVYATKKAIDAVHELVVAYLKFRMLQPPPDQQRRHIEVYDASGKLYEGKDKKRKKQ